MISGILRMISGILRVISGILRVISGILRVISGILRVISGILHVLKAGCRWCDCPADYGPSTTVYNRVNQRGRVSRLTG